MRKYPGFYRRFPDSKITMAEYDVDSEILFDLKFRLPFEYAEDLVRPVNSLIPMEKDFMLKKYLLSSETVATVVINGEYIATVRTDGIMIEGMTLDEEYKVKTQYSFDYLRDVSIIPVGFERTEVYSLEILMTPARLYYDQKNKSIFLNNKWVKIDFIPTMFKKKVYYKELMKTNAYAVIAVEDGFKLLTKEGIIL